MGSRNILVIGLWALAIIWQVSMLVLRADLLIALVIFLFALGVSFAAIATTPAMAKRTAEIKTEA